MSAENVSAIPFLVRSACLERRFLEDAAFSIEQVECGKVRVNLLLEAAAALDHRQVVRSSVLYRLLEAVLNVSAASVGVEAETLNFCCNVCKVYSSAEPIRCL